MDHFVLVACHQTFVANGGFLVNLEDRRENEEEKRVVSKIFDQYVLYVLYACRQTHWERIHGFDSLSELHGGCNKDGLCG